MPPTTYVYPTPTTRKALIDPKVYVGGVRRDVIVIYAYHDGGIRSIVWERQKLALTVTPQYWEENLLTITPPGVGADSFKLYRDGVQIYSGTALTYLDGALLAETQYTYKAEAYRGGVLTDSITVVATTLARGDMGLAVSGTPTWDSISVAWADPDKGGADSYVLLRGGVQIYAGTAKTATDPGRNAATQYAYEVRAMRGTTVVGTDTVNISTPARPSMTVSVSSVLWDRATVTWTDPGGGADTYTVTRASTQVYSGTAKTVTDTALLPSTSYTYIANAIRSGVTVGTITAGSITTPARADMALTVGTVTWDTVPLTWTDSSGGTIDQYKVYRTGTTGPVYTGTAKAFTDTLRLPSTSYTYTLRSYRAGVEIATADTVTATTSAYPDLGLALNGTVAYNSIPLKWNAKNGSVDEFELKRTSPSTVTLYTGGTGTSDTDTGLTASTSYTHTLYALRSNSTIKTDTLTTKTPVRPTSSGNINGPGAGSGYGWAQSSPKSLSGSTFSMPRAAYISSFKLLTSGYGTTGWVDPIYNGHHFGFRTVASTTAGSPGWTTFDANDLGVGGPETHVLSCDLGGNSSYKTQWGPYSGGSYSTTVGWDDVSYWYYSASWVRTPDGLYINDEDEPDVEGEHIDTHTESWTDDAGAIVFERIYVKGTDEMIHEWGVRPEHVKEAL